MVMMVDADADANHASDYSVFSFFPSVNTSRMNTLRYDTPSIGPVSLSASIQKDSADGHDWHFGASLRVTTSAPPM